MLRSSSYRCHNFIRSYINLSIVYLILLLQSWLFELQWSSTEMLVFLFLGARLSSVTNLMKQQKLKKSPLVEIGPVVGESSYT